MEHKNRDYFAKPVQSDRNRHDYGNTKLQPDEYAPPRWLLWYAIAACCAVIGFIIF